MGDGHGGRTLQTLDGCHLESEFAEELDDVGVADRLIRRHDADLLHPEQLQRPLTSLCSRGHRQPTGAFVDLLDELAVALHSVPERLGRHSHHHVVGFGRHDAVDGVADLLADLQEEILERLVRIEDLITDVDASGMSRDTGDRHRVELGLDDGVGTRDDHTELATPPQLIASTVMRVGHVHESHRYPSRSVTSSRQPRLFSTPTT